MDFQSFSALQCLPCGLFKFLLENCNKPNRLTKGLNVGLFFAAFGFLPPTLEIQLIIGRFQTGTDSITLKMITKLWIFRSFALKIFRFLRSFRSFKRNFFIQKRFRLIQMPSLGVLADKCDPIKTTDLLVESIRMTYYWLASLNGTIYTILLNRIY